MKTLKYFHFNRKPLLSTVHPFTSAAPISHSGPNPQAVLPAHLGPGAIKAKQSLTMKDFWDFTQSHTNT